MTQQLLNSSHVVLKKLISIIFNYITMFLWVFVAWLMCNLVFKGHERGAPTKTEFTAIIVWKTNHYYSKARWYKQESWQVLLVDTQIDIKSQRGNKTRIRKKVTSQRKKREKTCCMITLIFATNNWFAAFSWLTSLSPYWHYFNNFNKVMLFLQLRFDA